MTRPDRETVLGELATAQSLAVAFALLFAWRAAHGTSPAVLGLCSAASLAWGALVWRRPRLSLPGATTTGAGAIWLVWVEPLGGLHWGLRAFLTVWVVCRVAGHWALRAELPRLLPIDAAERRHLRRLRVADGGFLAALFGVFFGVPRALDWLQPVWPWDVDYAKPAWVVGGVLLVFVLYAAARMAWVGSFPGAEGPSKVVARK